MRIEELARKAGIGFVTAGLTIAAGSGAQENKPGGVMIVESRYYCNVKALTAAERTRHTQLTAKLLSKRRETIETDKGYEFQYAPEDVSVAEVAEWVVAEGRCCPFFDFHIDLEKQGRLVCLRLTGGEGIKAFIRSEFGLK